MSATPIKLNEYSQSLPVQDVAKYYAGLREQTPGFLLESLAISERYNRISLFGTDPVLQMKGDAEGCNIRVLNERAKPYLEVLQAKYKLEKTDQQTYRIHLPKADFHDEESQRFYRPNSAQVIRYLLKELEQDQITYAGLYGAFGFRFIHLFEDLPETKTPSTPHFNLMLYDTFVFQNHLMGSSEVKVYRMDVGQAQEDAQALAEKLKPLDENDMEHGSVGLEDIHYTPDEAGFKDLVESARDLCRRGELMEVVFARQLKAQLKGDPFQLYLHYRKTNPAPYQFLFDLGPEEYLVGASPEMMIRYEKGRVQLRPISGTAPRGSNAVEDHEQMMYLLTSEKEKAELDMLVDLGRNDLARICQPGISVADYRYIEKYSKVMHTVAEVRGQIRGEYTGLDALIASLNAGTLSGAPKWAALKYIEEMEPFERGYYGGACGMLRFSGEVDTAIVIRSAHIQQGQLSYASGATLLYDSEPDYELRETRIKAAAFESIFQQKPQAV